VVDDAALDDASRRAATDPGAFWRLIAGLPEQAAEAWDAGRAWASTAALRTPRRVVVAGMGGSAIGAEIVATIAAGRSATPIEVVRGYELPAVDAETLVVACSFSGNTEEVLAVFDEAAAGPATRLAITTGGELAARAARDGVPTFTFGFDGPPRAALGYGTFPLLAILRAAGALDVDDREVDASLEALRTGRDEWGPSVATGSNLAKQIAGRISGRVAVVLGAGVLRVAATRWAGEIAENASQWAFPLALPEADHNLVVGFARPRAGVEQLHAVLLDGPVVYERNRRRVQLTADELDRAGVSQQVVAVEGTAALEAVLRAGYLGDWVSYYLALLNGVDPLDIAPIDRVKAALGGGERASTA
jgi:glucose/mannose-6-phosphate isomerase